jgi:hypothetical protein
VFVVVVVVVVPNCVFLLEIISKTKTKPKKEREKRDQRRPQQRDAPKLLCGREKPHKKKTKEMASFAEAPAGDVAKGTLSPSFFLSLFSLVCECDNIY